MRARIAISGKSISCATRDKSGSASNACRCSSYNAQIARTAFLGLSIDSSPTKSSNRRDFRNGLRRNEPCAVSCCTSGNVVIPSASNCFKNFFTSCPTIGTRVRIFAASARGRCAALVRSWLSHTSSPSAQTTNSGAIIKTACAVPGSISSISFVSITAAGVSSFIVSGNLRSRLRNSNFTSIAFSFAVSSRAISIAGKSSATGASNISAASRLLIYAESLPAINFLRTLSFTSSRCS